MPKTYWIINHKDGTYIETSDETFDGDWKAKYPHAAKLGYEWITAFSPWECDRCENGIYFDYSLCCDGGLFTLIVDTNQHTEKDIREAQAQLRRDRDVVKIYVTKITKMEGVKI